MLNESTSLICPNNDLESQEIIRIAVKYPGIDLRKSAQGWGGKLGKEPLTNLSNLKKRVIIVELPGEHEEEQLRREGHDVIIIDHHDYGALKRWKRDSSLEQFCALVDHEMSPDEWAIAVGDRDFIPGLSQIGLSYEKMADLRHRERVILGHDGLFEEALAFVGKHRKHFEDIDVVVSPDKYRMVMADAAQWPERTQYEKCAKKKETIKLRPCLIIYHADDTPDDIIQINYYGPMEMKPAFDALLEDPRLVDLDIWCGGGAYSFYWGAKRKHPLVNMDDLIDRIISFTLIKGRPLRYFWTSFLFPFRFKNNPSPPIAATEQHLDPSRHEDEQEALYFLPHIRKLLYSRVTEQVGSKKKTGDDSGPRKWVLKPPHGSLSLEIEDVVKSAELQGTGKSPPISLDIAEIALYRFFNGVHFLSISVAYDTGMDFWKDSDEGTLPFWRVLLGQWYPELHANALSVENALIFNNLGRLVYAAFDEPAGHQKIARVLWLSGNELNSEPFVLHRPAIQANLNPQLSPVVHEMIRQFTTAQTQPSLEPLLDERMFVHTCMAFAGDPPQHEVGKDRYHTVFSLATYVDRFQDGFSHLGGYAYDPAFVRHALEPFTYRRWDNVSGNLYGFTRYSAAYLAFGDFFHGVVSQHVRTMYLRMSLMGLFYRASVVDYAHQIAAVKQPATIQDDLRVYLNRIRSIHWELVRFATKHWFPRLTSQDQGIEIFDLQRKAFAIEDEYKMAREEIQQSYQFLTAHNQSKFAYWAYRLSIPTVIFAILSILIGVVGMTVCFSSEDIGFVEHISKSATWLCAVFGLIGLGLLAAGISFYVRGKESKPDLPENRSNGGQK